MRRSFRNFAVTVLGNWLLSGCAPAASDPAAPLVLGAAPLCEASAIQRSTSGPTYWVADNEIRGKLFAFEEKSGRLLPQPSLDWVWEPEDSGPKDIEALAATQNTLFVVGSHSRSKRCQPKSGQHARRQMLKITRSEPGTTTLSGERILQHLQTPVLTIESCVATLFERKVPHTALAICSALVAAEASAVQGACNTLNIEGAAFVTDRGAQRLWLGLRSPLVDGKAVLLRVDGDRQDLGFDDAALVSLGGRALRGLDARGERLFGLASLEGKDTVLFETTLASVRAETAPKVRVRGLSLAAEGVALVPDESAAWVVTDGAESKRPGPCKVPAGQSKVAW